MRYSIIISQPGYLPDAEPYVVEDAEAARDAFLSEIEIREEVFVTDTSHAEMATFEAARVAVRKHEWSTSVGTTIVLPGGGDPEYDLGYVLTAEPVEPWTEIDEDELPDESEVIGVTFKASYLTVDKLPTYSPRLVRSSDGIHDLELVYRDGEGVILDREGNPARPILRGEADVWQLSELPPTGCEAVAKLWSWSTNYDYPSPFVYFLDLIGYSDEHFGEPMADMAKVSERIGMVEADKLGRALVEYADRPSDVLRFVEDLLAAELDEAGTR